MKRIERQQNCSKAFLELEKKPHFLLLVATNHLRILDIRNRSANILSRTKNVPFWQQKSRLANARTTRDIFVAFLYICSWCSKKQRSMQSVNERILEKMQN